MTDFDDAQARVHDQRRASEPVAGRSTPAPPGSAAHFLHMQRTVGNAAVVQRLAEEGDDHPIKSVIQSGGSPLEAPVRSKMEGAFGQDFSDVRVHSDSSASSSAQAVAATAATVGNHIVFRSGEYNPSSSKGQHLLAHELTHVVQQRSGPVTGTPQAGGISVSDPSDSFETAAESNAGRITSALSAQRQPDSDDVQRQPDPTVIQREAEGDEMEGEEG
ncbi:MAG TPA: DUF4157 domain-containing protein [Acidimicrobiales bacterium]|jgi:hypothetical protein|nr:DUF4157 domain-containing protein [Acidimicrobiales bacterium]